MLRKLTRYASTTSDESSEDDRSHLNRQVRMPVSNVQIRQFSDNQPYTSTGGNSTVNKSKNPSQNNVVPYLTRLRSRIPLASSNSGKSSTSETDDSIQPNQRKSLRASSDYNTGARSDEGNDTNPERILNSLSLGTNSVQSSTAFQYSSDDSSNIQTRSLKRRKTSVINLASSTDSSDSGVPNQVGRGLGKRTRLCTSSESSTSIDNSSGEHSDEIHVNALENIMENESMSNLTQNGLENDRRTPNGDRIRRIPRLSTTGQNQIPALRQSRPSSSRQNTTRTTANEIIIPRSFRQARGRPSSNENHLRSNTIQLRTNRSAAPTIANSRNRVPNADRQNSRSSARTQNNMTITLPTFRQNLRLNVVNSQNPSNASSSNRRDSRPTTSRQNNTRSAESSQNNVRPLVTRARQNNRRTRANGIVGRTSTNSSTTSTRRQNITFTGQPIISDSENGFSLRISIQNGQNITYVRPPIDSRERLDAYSSSGSSSDDMRPVLRRRRVIFSSDNNTTSSDSEASSVFIRRSRRRVQMVISDSESTEESCIQVATSIKLNETILSDSDGETEKCPICFGRFDKQEVGSPKTCEHFFCLECIKKWAENNNTCPVDRRTFNSIIVRASVQGEVIREDVVPPTNNMDTLPSDLSFLGSFSDSDSDTTDDMVFFGSDSDYDIFPGGDFSFDGPDEICSVCMLSLNAEEMLQCDSCDNVYHLQCVALESIPTAWVCPDCGEAATSD